MIARALIELREAIDGLTAFTKRAACTDSERRAAAWLHDDLRARGHDARVETIWVRPQWVLSLGLHAALGVAVSLLSTAQPEIATAVAALLALSYGLEAAGRGGLLRRLFFRRATQIVLVEPQDPDAIALLVTAPIDAPRRGLIGDDAWRRFATRLQRVAGGASPGPQAWVAIALGLVAVTSGIRALGVTGAVIGAVQLVPTVALLLALAAAIDIALAAPIEGENDPASGVAAALAFHDELVGDPADRLSAGLVLAGAGSTQPLAFARYLRREKPAPRQTIVVELGPCGVGEPVWWTSHPQVISVARRAGGLAMRWRRPTSARAASRRGIPAITVRCLDPTGIAPESTPVAEPAVLAALDFCLALADEFTVELEAIEEREGSA